MPTAYPKREGGTKTSKGTVHPKRKKKGTKTSTRTGVGSKVHASRKSRINRAVREAGG